MNVTTLHKATATLQGINGLGRIIEVVKAQAFQPDAALCYTAFEIESQAIDGEFYEKLRRMYINALEERKAKLQAEFDAL